MGKVQTIYVKHKAGIMRQQSVVTKNATPHAPCPASFCDGNRIALIN